MASAMTYDTSFESEFESENDAWPNLTLDIKGRNSTLFANVYFSVYFFLNEF